MMFFPSCSEAVLLPDTLRFGEAHLAVQENFGFHTKNWTLQFSPPKTPMRAGGPQTALQGRWTFTR